MDENKKKTLILIAIILFLNVGTILLTISFLDYRCDKKDPTDPENCVERVPLYIKHPTLAYVGIGLNCLGLVLTGYFRIRYKTWYTLCAIPSLLFTLGAAFNVFSKAKSNVTVIGICGVILALFGSVALLFYIKMYFY